MNNKRYNLCEQVICGDVFDKYPTGIHDKDTLKVLRYPELVDILNEQNEIIREKSKELKRFKKDVYNRYHESKAKDKEIEKLKMQKSELIETIDFCKDLLYHTNNSKRMKELRKQLSVWVNDEC